MELNLRENTTKWAKFGEVQELCFVGREYLCFGGGCHMLFFSVNSMKETIYEAKNEETGIGVACIAGLVQFPICAFAENKSRARVFVMTCPEFKQISLMTDGTDDGYINMSFSEAEFLVTLTGLPSYSIVIWNWRNGDKIAVKQTDVLSDKQLIKCSYGSSVYLAQLGIGTKKLNIWDILIAGKRCLTIQHVIMSPKDSEPFTSIQWTSEGGLFVLDIKGNVYTVTTDYNLDPLIQFSEAGDNPTYLVWYKAGLTIIGPNGIVYHYKKVGTWKCDWSVKPETPMIRLLTNQRDLLVGISQRKDVMLFAENAFKSLNPCQSRFDGFCLIYPMGKYIVTLAHHEELTAWEVSTGNKLDTIKLEGFATYIKENSEYPYFAVTFSIGLLQLYSFHDDKKIKLLTSFHLTRNSLSSVKFAEMGKLIVVGDLSCGEFFIIEGTAGTRMHVIATVCAHKQIADYLLVASKTCMRLFAIQVTSDLFIAGNKIMRFCIIKNKQCPDIKEYTLEEPKRLYTQLYGTTRPDRDRVFYAVPLESKSIHELETKRGDSFARLVGRIQSDHPMRKFVFNFDRHHSISFGYDGLVIMRTKNFDHIGMIMPHHRFDGGILRAYFDPLGVYVISLGRNGVLICNQLIDVQVNVEKEIQIREHLHSDIVTYMFTHSTGGFLPKGEYLGKTWLEVQELMKIEFERRKCEKERQEILTGIGEVKSELQSLLTRNLEGPENEIIDIQDFNLDSELKEDLTVASIIECKRTKLYLEALIIARNKVYKWIKEYCWDHMATPGKSLFGIFGIFDVENYVLLPTDVEQQEILKRIIEQREIEEMMANDEIFTPWVPKTTSQMRLHLSITPKIEQRKTQRDSESDDDSEDTTNRVTNDSDNIMAFGGATTHQFITMESGHYNQFEIQTFLQSEYQTILSRVENIKLKEYFNEQFEFLKSLKVREINNVVERNARMRHVLSELNYFSANKVDILIDDPVWEQKENPELILKVADNEVGIAPYISPSRQAILDAEAAERERLRLLRLADDFKERALMAMMNGVLEIRWEDELRKDVPMPKCMIEKQPEEYKEDDLRAIKEYESQVKFLQSERDRYKRMLTAEYGNVGTVLRETVKKFNARVQDLLVLKVKVDSAIGQENLKINRLRLKNSKRIEMNEMEREAQKAITMNEKKMEEIQKLIASLYDNLHECRSHLDAIQGKEKILDKAFRRDFLETSPSCQEVALKFYKKRPKTNIRAMTSITVLLELAKCTVTRERTLILTPDALDFLRAMDVFDQYVGVPNAVDEPTYALVCKHRRLKIESEIKIKAASMEITECENTIATMQRTVTQKKDFNQILVTNLAQIRAKKIREAHDIQVQLVIREGLVEIATCGETKDFDDAILISRKDVEDINKVILKAGERKLKAMKDTMNFRRGILAMEWEHRRMKMTIRDRLEHIADIRSVKVTKETQSYLKSKARGDAPEKVLTFEQEVDIAKLSYTRIIDDRKAAVADLQWKIDTVLRDNKVLDRTIKHVNVDICEQQLDVDSLIQEAEKRVINLRTATLLKRTKLVREIQENHNAILMLQTELEILRLKTYPTLKYKIFT